MLDAVVCGGGVAGLWTLHLLRRKGLNAVLLESEALGARQTLASQGMLHRGGKYVRDAALRETLEQAAATWERCLEGKGSVDLRAARILSTGQYKLWAGGMLARCIARAAAGALAAESARVENGDLPAALRAFRGAVYRIEEKVLDIKTVLRALQQPNAASIYRAGVKAVGRNGERVESITVSAGGQDATLAASAYFFCCGEGNEALARELGLPAERTQRRPLKQILVRPMRDAVYGHCFKARWRIRDMARPVVTISSHDSPGGLVWYLGGDVAEKGSLLSDGEAIRNARDTMREIFPGVAWNDCEWAAYAIDRAEAGAGSKLPEGPQALFGPNWALAWPTKLVLAPLLAQRLVDWCGVTPAGGEGAFVFPHADPGSYPWETNLRWSKIP